MVKVSVCIQTYNHQPFIAQALDSVLMQEMDFDYEIVLGEDESRDGTREICVGYARRYPDVIRLFLRSRKDVIYVDGRPTGRFNFTENLEAARGKYIALLDGDDYWTDPHKLQKEVDLLDSHRELAICFHRVLKRHEASGEETLAPSREPAADRLTISDLLQRNFIPTCSVMFRNRLFEEFPSWFRITPSGDWPLHILNALHGDIGYINQVMAVYRLHSSGVWSVRSPAEQKQRTVETLEILRENLDPRYDQELALSLARWRIRLLYSIAREMGGKAAMQHVPNLLMSSDMPKVTVLRASLGLVWTRILSTLELNPPAGSVF